MILDRLVFGQHRPSTLGHIGPDWLSCPVEQFPHTAFLRGDERAYRSYLNDSWRDVARAPRTVDAQVARFRQMAEVVEAEGCVDPVEVVERPDGKLVLADGNHRAALAFHLGLDLPVRELALAKHCEQVVDLTRGPRYGTNDSGAYQTLRAGGRVLLHGRRSLSERHSLLRREDLVGKRVADIGCNIGASAVHVHETGASSVDAWDSEPSIATAALRISVAIGYPVRYHHRAAERPPDGAWDTGLCFSVHEHADVGPSLARCRVVYLETHRATEPPVELTRGREVEMLGCYRDGGVRRLYRMTR